jgi:hypothetical protein
MMLAPQLQLSGVRLTIGPGMIGIRQTLRAMRRMVQAFRVDPLLRQTATTLVTRAPPRDQRAEVEVKI